MGGVATHILAGLPLLHSLVIAGAAAVATKRVRRLPELEALPERARACTPRVSIVVPACNEESTLEVAIRSKLATDYPDLEIVVVDDRSTDATGTIADAIAREDPRLRVVHIRELPAGWLGKVHALDRGARAATGDILLFSDADVEFSPHLVMRSVATLEAEQLDFITLVPHLKPHGMLLDSTMTTFLRLLVTAGRIWQMRDPKSRVAVGAGLFNLVRREVYERSPGFEWIKMEVADDVTFGQMMKRAGARCEVFNGKEDVTLAFYGSIMDLARGLEKNAYAASGWKPAIGAVIVTLLAYLELGPLVLLALTSGLPFVMALAAVVVTSLTQATIARWASRSVLAAAIPAVGSLVLLSASVRALVLTHVRGGISWRGTFYSLAELRQGVRFERT